MRGRVLDPITRDYVREGGSRRYTTTIAPKLYHAFRAHRGLWVGDPDRGCNFWRLARGTIHRGTRAEAENELRNAVQPFLSEGLARDFTCRVDLSEHRRIVTESSIVDTQAGAVDLADLTRFVE